MEYLKESLGSENFDHTTACNLANIDKLNKIQSECEIILQFIDYPEIVEACIGVIKQLAVPTGEVILGNEYKQSC